MITLHIDPVCVLQACTC